MTNSRRQFGSIRKLPSGRFQARYRAPDGQQRKPPSTFTTKTAAGNWLATIEADLYRGEWYDDKRGEVLVGEIAERWYLTKMHLRPTMKVQYRSNFDDQIRPCLGDRPVGSVTTLDIHEWLAERRANTRIGPNSVVKAYQLLRQVFRPQSTPS